MSKNILPGGLLAGLNTNLPGVAGSLQKSGLISVPVSIENNPGDLVLRKIMTLLDIWKKNMLEVFQPELQTQR